MARQRRVLVGAAPAPAIELVQVTVGARPRTWDVSTGSADHGHTAQAGCVTGRRAWRRRHALTALEERLGEGRGLELLKLGGADRLEQLRHTATVTAGVVCRLGQVGRVVKRACPLTDERDCLVARTAVGD